MALGASGKSVNSSPPWITLGINTTWYQSIEIFHSWQRRRFSTVYYCWNDFLKIFYQSIGPDLHNTGFILTPGCFHTIWTKLMLFSFELEDTRLLSIHFGIQLHSIALRRISKGKVHYFVSYEVIFASQLGMISSTVPMHWGNHIWLINLHLLYWLLLLGQFFFHTLLHMNPKTQFFKIYDTDSKQIVYKMKENNIALRRLPQKQTFSILHSPLNSSCNRKYGANLKFVHILTKQQVMEWDQIGFVQLYDTGKWSGVISINESRSVPHRITMASWSCTPLTDVKSNPVWYKSGIV